MRRIYMPIAIAVCLLFMYLGYGMGSYAPAETKMALEKIYKRNLELSSQGKESDKRALVYKQKYVADSVRADSLAAAIAKYDKKIMTITRRYEKKLVEVQRYTQVQRDSFFYAKYPGQDTIININGRKVISDLVAGEGLELTNRIQAITIDKLKEIGFEKDTLINHKQNQLTEAEFKNKILEEKVDIANAGTDIYKGRARTFKRQRNNVIAGAGVIIAGAIYVFVH